MHCQGGMEKVKKTGEEKNNISVYGRHLQMGKTI
jgi:hypothetical protein